MRQGRRDIRNLVPLAWRACRPAGQWPGPGRRARAPQRPGAALLAGECRQGQVEGGGVGCLPGENHLPACLSHGQRDGAPVVLEPLTRSSIPRALSALTIVVTVLGRMFSSRASWPGRAPGCSASAASSSSWATASVLPGSAARAPRRRARRSRATPSAISSACRPPRRHRDAASGHRGPSGRRGRAAAGAPDRGGTGEAGPHRDEHHGSERRHGPRQPGSRPPQERPRVQSERHDGHAGQHADPPCHVHHPACRRCVPRRDRHRDLRVVRRSVYARGASRPGSTTDAAADIAAGAGTASVARRGPPPCRPGRTGPFTGARRRGCRRLRCPGWRRTGRLPRRVPRCPGRRCGRSSWVKARAASPALAPHTLARRVYSPVSSTPLPSSSAAWMSVRAAARTAASKPAGRLRRVLWRQ